MEPGSKVPQNGSDVETEQATARGEARVAGKADRRRPGRPAEVSPNLVPLLRGSPDSINEHAIASTRQTFGDPDQLRAARGIVAAVLICAAVWVALIFVAVRVLS